MLDGKNIDVGRDGVIVPPASILELTLTKHHRPRHARYGSFQEVSIHLKHHGRHLHLLQTTHDRIICFTDEKENLVIMGISDRELPEILWWERNVPRVLVSQVL